MDTSTELLLKDILREVQDFRKEMNGRVRKLEIWRGYITGAVTILTALGIWKLFL